MIFRSRSANFYDALLAEMGIGRLMEMETFIVWSLPGQPGLALTKPFNGEAATVGNGVMVAIHAENPETVDRMYNKALELGATDEGPAGSRGDRFYAGYWRDPDGNILCFICRI